MMDWLICSCAVVLISSWRRAQTTHLAEEGVEAMHLLLLFEKGVVLGDAAQGELIHEVDLKGVDHVLVLRRV